MRTWAHAGIIALLALLLTASPSLAFTIADPGFAAADYASISGVTGLAFDSGGTLHTNTDGGLAYVGTRLYAVSRTAREIRELDAGGATIRTVTTSTDIDCPDGLAGTSADLYVTTCAGVYRIRNVNASPTIEYFSNPGSSPLATHAITISADGLVFATAGSNIWKVGTVTSPAPSFGAVFIGVANANGLATLSAFGTTTFRFLFTTTSDGTVRVYDHTGAIAQHAILTGGSGGDASVIGSDGCLYVPQTSAVERISNADGTCDLIAALGATPHIELTGGATNAHIGTTPATFTAALTNAPSGTNVVFTVTGVNPQTATVLMDPITRRASYTYTGTTAGTDTITAAATIGATTITSSPLTQLWKPPFDSTPPLISYAVTGGGTGAVCPGATSPDDPLATFCGWYATPPSVHWTFSDPESGIGAASGCDDFTLAGDSPLTGTPVTCTVTNGDGVSTHKTVILQALITPPLVTASAMSGLAPYVPGTPTRQPVTVTFTCTHAAGPGAIASCTAPITISSGDGTPRSVSGTAVDLAGKSATAVFAGIVVDTAGPAIAIDTGGYVPATWTHDNVTFTWTCTDPSGVASCPAPVTLTATTAPYTVQATDALGNTSTATTGQVNIDKTAPTIGASATTADGHAYTAGTPTNQNVTVHYTCGTDGAPLTGCTADQLVTSSTPSVSGTATDAAGNAASTSFGPIVIDHVAPTITPVLTVNGAPYAGGWTRGPVLVHFDCHDETALLSCTPDQTLTADQNATVTGTAQDVAGNTTSATTVAIQIDRTPPTTSATVSGTLSGAPGTYLFTATVTLSATDAGSGVASLTYTADGVTTTVSAASASVTFDTQGPHTVTYHATDALGNTETDHTQSLTIIFRQATALTITSGRFIATDGSVSARLMNTDANVPVAGETVSFSTGGHTQTGVTDANGVATVALGLAPGAYTLAASYAGTDLYFPSSATAQPMTVFAVTRFVVYAPAATLGAQVQFYGGDWSKQIADKDVRKGFDDFKGYADGVQGGMWTARSGDAVKAPRTVPEYIGVILTTHASKTRDTITGDVAGMAVVRVTGGDDSKKPRPYDGKLGERGYGTVVGRP